MEVQYYECACFSPEHTLRFVFDPEDKEIYTEVYLNHYQNFFKRIWIAIKYVFGYQCKYGHFDCFIMRSDDAQRLIGLLTKVGDSQWGANE